MRKCLAKIILISVLFIIVFSLEINAEEMWVENGIPICRSDNLQFSPRIVSDGSGGAIIVWDDRRNGDSNNWDIYIQRIDKNGNNLWVEDGVLVCGVNDHQTNPSLVSDGKGGAVVIWKNLRDNNNWDWDWNWDLYAQRIDSDGNKLWPEDGIPICTGEPNSRGPFLLFDEDENTIIVWGDERNGNGNNVYVQKVDANGNILWEENGKPVCVTEDVHVGGLISDGRGGVIVLINQGMEINANIYAQRINENGDLIWDGQIGAPVCEAPNMQFAPKMVSDGNGGAIIAWMDRRWDPDNTDIYAQRIDLDGNLLWQANGVPICTRGGDQFNPKLTACADGGAIITWDDYRCFMDNGIYAQKIRADGSTAWALNGVPVCTAGGAQHCTDVVSDGRNGAIIAWQDERNSRNNVDIYVQRVDARGNVVWVERPVCNAGGNQYRPYLVSDNCNGAVVAWQDGRNGEDNTDIYAYRTNDSVLSNLGFELGDFINWSLSNNIQNDINADVKTDLDRAIDPFGNYMGFISNYGKAAEEEVVIKSPWIYIPNDANIVTYKWNFLTNETPAAPEKNNVYNDTLTVRREIEGERGITTTIARMSVNNLVYDDTISVPGYRYATGWKNSSSRVSINRGARVRYHFAIKNVGDGSVETAVLLDEISIR